MKQHANETPKSTKEPKPQPQRGWRNTFITVIIALAVISVVSTYMTGTKQAQPMDFSEFMIKLNQGQIGEVTIRTAEQTVTGKTKSGEQFKTYYINYPEFISELRTQGVQIKINPANSNWVWSVFLQAFLPFILIALLWFFIFRQAQGANNQALSFGKTRAVPWKKDSKQTITFKDIAGIDEAVEELNEIVDFLKNPKRYHDLGAKIPKGALLMGAPGTGKTLLAKAIAGEADVPFYSLSGSDFVEMFVGVGASRVRDLFRQAKKSQPSIIYIDEIDAVGRQRGAGLGGGHDEREQTLNQLLVEMDGFDAHETVIILASTNRPDILDPALLRPGRFDRQIVVDKPDVKGRLDILKIHARNKKISKNLHLDIIAKGTAGFTGADLENLLNESALLTARRNKKTIGKEELDEAMERVIAGPQRKSRLVSTREKEIVAYHEVGHAMVAFHTKHSDPVHKITALPRGLALGYTLQLPQEDRYLISKDEIEDRIKVLLGGRVAEELTFSSVTSGASDDIKKATELARSYVCSYGMDKTLGMRKYGKSQEQVFLGRDYSDHSKDYSEETAHLIDTEIKKLIDHCHSETVRILTQHQETLGYIAKILIQKEVIEREEFEELVQKKEGKLLRKTAPEKREVEAETDAEG